MERVRRSIVALLVGLLVVLAGCSLPFVDEGQAETGTAATATTPSAATGTDDGTREPTVEETEPPTATPTPTPTRTPEPTRTVASETGIRVVEINADVESVDDEYIVLKNAGDGPLDLSGWRVKDEDGQVYTFPDGYTLGIGETVTLHSGRGTQTESDRYWWSDDQVWDANGDTISIHDERGQKVYERSYS